MLNKHEAGIAYYDFFHWVEGILKQDKFNRFNQFFQFPNPNNELTDSIHTELSKALNSEDYVETYVFNSDKAHADWNIYKTRFNDFWQAIAWEEYRSSINSFMVIDLPLDQITDKPEPSYFFVNIDNVIEASVNDDNSCNWLIFKSNHGIIAYCDEFMRLLDESGKLIVVNGKPVEIAHNLGETPARNFWTSTINSRSNVNKRAAISGTLSEFDWLLFHRINKKYLDTGNAYPIVFQYVFDEDDEGVNSDDKPTSVKGDTKNSGAALLGPGSHESVPPPVEKEDPDYMKKPIHTEMVDIAALDFATKEELRLKTELFIAAVGAGGEANNETAKNEKQIESGFESRTATLQRIAYNLALAKSWANGMICKIRYGDLYISNFISGGSKFFLLSEADINKQISDTDSDILKESLHTQLIEVRAKKDDKQKLRLKMLSDLDPFALRSIDEVISLFEKNVISREDFLLKEKFITFVKRFERENVPITEFEPAKTYNERIELILKKLKSYATSEQIEDPQNQE